MIKTPKLRFKEFSGDWESDRLSKVCDINPKTSQIPDEFYYIDLESVVKGELIKENIITKSEAPSRAQRVLSQGDTLFQTVRPYQNNNYYFSKERDLSTVASTGYAQLRSYTNSEFLYHLIHTSRFGKNVLLRCTGSNYPAINTTDLSEIEIYYPSKEEQDKIASFLSLIDDKISLQGEKLELLKDYKKGMMQKIFRRELRFKDDDGRDYPEWEHKKLNRIVERITRKNKGSICTLPLTISAQYGLVDQVTFFNKTVASANLEGYYLLEKGEFAYNKSYSTGYPFGAIKRLDRYDMGVLSSLYICFSILEGVDSDFLVQYFETSCWHKEISMIAVEGARNHGLLNISVSDFFETYHWIPCYDEQVKIGEFLGKIDEKINKEQEKLDSLNKYKKGLLQQMFV